MLENKKILIGVSSGIAIYKVLDLISRLKKEGALVKVIMTENACEFISPILFEVMSKSKVYVKQFEEHGNGEVSHVDLAKEADVFLLAPATANTIGKIANGIADNLLTSTVLAYPGPLVISPTMNTQMLENINTQANIAKLRDQGHHIIEPNAGFLACNDIGKGRMAEPLEILDYLEYFFSSKDLVGKKIIVTAGPTIEEIDPVRYISNYSSGKMGYALARAARNRGAKVILISGPTKLDKIKGVDTINIKSTIDLQAEIDKYFKTSDVLIMAAAPSDFRILNKHEEKIKKKDINSLDLATNTDIVRHFGEIKDKQIIIGFAAETENLLENAKGKLEAKKLDYIVANDVSSSESGFNVDFNQGYIISKNNLIEIKLMSKYDMANKILDVL